MSFIWKYLVNFIFSKYNDLEDDENGEQKTQIQFSTGKTIKLPETTPTPSITKEPSLDLKTKKRKDVEKVLEDEETVVQKKNVKEKFDPKAHKKKYLRYHENVLKDLEEKKKEIERFILIYYKDKSSNQQTWMNRRVINTLLCYLLSINKISEDFSESKNLIILFSRLSYHSTLKILSFITFISCRRCFDVKKLYGYFKSDFTRKAFLIFPYWDDFIYKKMKVAEAIEYIHILCNDCSDGSIWTIPTNAVNQLNNLKCFSSIANSNDIKQMNCISRLPKKSLVEVAHLERIINTKEIKESVENYLIKTFNEFYNLRSLYITIQYDYMRNNVFEDTNIIVKRKHSFILPKLKVFRSEFFFPNECFDGVKNLTSIYLSEWKIYEKLVNRICDLKYLRDIKLIKCQILAKKNFYKIFLKENLICISVQFCYLNGVLFPLQNHFRFSKMMKEIIFRYNEEFEDYIFYSFLKNCNCNVNVLNLSLSLLNPTKIFICSNEINTNSLQLYVNHSSNYSLFLDIENLKELTLTKTGLYKYNSFNLEFKQIHFKLKSIDFFCSNINTNIISQFVSKCVNIESISFRKCDLCSLWYKMLQIQSVKKVTILDKNCIDGKIKLDKIEQLKVPKNSLVENLVFEYYLKMPVYDIKLMEDISKEFERLFIFLEKIAKFKKMKSLKFVVMSSIYNYGKCLFSIQSLIYGKVKELIPKFKSKFLKEIFIRNFPESKPRSLYYTRKIRKLFLLKSLLIQDKTFLKSEKKNEFKNLVYFRDIGMDGISELLMRMIPFSIILYIFQWVEVPILNDKQKKLHIPYYGHDCYHNIQSKEIKVVKQIFENFHINKKMNSLYKLPLNIKSLSLYWVYKSKNQLFNNFSDVYVNRLEKLWVRKGFFSFGVFKIKDYCSLKKAHFENVEIIISSPISIIFFIKLEYLTFLYCNLSNDILRVLLKFKDFWGSLKVLIIKQKYIEDDIVEELKKTYPFANIVSFKKHKKEDVVKNFGVIYSD